MTVVTEILNEDINVRTRSLRRSQEIFLFFGAPRFFSCQLTGKNYSKMRDLRAEKSMGSVGNRARKAEC